jgi:hypothetical protein
MVGWEAFKAAFPDAHVTTEGGHDFVIVPSLRFDSNGQEYEMLTVIVPEQVSQLGGYTTRLLLERATTKPVNWTTVPILGRSWSTWSWNNVPSNIPLLEILGNHLSALA